MASGVRLASREDVPRQITALKADTDGTILVAGSGTLVRTLLEHDLVD